MKIDGMEAVSFSASKADGGSIQAVSSPQVVSDGDENKTVNNDRRNLSQMSQFERRELPISEKVVIDAIEKANRAISGANRKFEFSIHEKTKEIMIKVLDSDTNQVIREIPPEKILDMVAKMWEMAGLIVDERR